MEKRVCSKCKEEKELTEFPKGTNQCKLCLKELYLFYLTSKIYLSPISANLKRSYQKVHQNQCLKRLLKQF